MDRTNTSSTDGESTPAKAKSPSWPSGSEGIQAVVRLIRGQRVMLDADLARLYGVPTKALNQAVKRNAQRFPEDFCFRLLASEVAELVTNCDQFGRRKHSYVMPLVFTEHGALMAASVLNTPKAVEVSLHVVRAFVRMRELAITHTRLAKELEKIRDRLDVHDESIGAIIGVLNQLLTSAAKPAKRIGYKTETEEKRP